MLLCLKWIKGMYVSYLEHALSIHKNHMQRNHLRGAKIFYLQDMIYWEQSKLALSPTNKSYLNDQGQEFWLIP